MSQLMQVNKIVLNNYSTRTAQFEGRAYIVAPVVILTEGVHCGSAGCKFYPAEELAQLPPAWNGRPLPVLHPEAENGDPLSANSPEIIERQSVGYLFNIVFDNGALKGEIWVDIQKAQEISPETLAIIRAHGPLEVSTGLWSVDEMIPGQWHGEDYDSVVRGIVPDHLALLPGGEGACNINDGCGVRANQKKGGEEKLVYKLKDNSRISEIRTDNKLEKLAYKISGLTKKEEFRITMLIDNELSHSDIRMSLQSEVDKLDNPMKFHYVLDVFDDFFVYRVAMEKNGGSRLYKQTYSVKENDEIEFGEEVDEVKQVVSFEKLEKGKEVNNMADKKCCPKKVQALIDNKDTGWTEADKEMLSNMSEEQLTRLEPVVNTPDENDDTKKELDALKAENKTLKANAKDPKEVKFEDLLANAPAGIQESIQHGTSLFEAQKANIITQITGNENCDYTEAELKKMDFVGLQKLSKAFRVTEDYSVNASQVPVPDVTDEEPLVVNRGDNGTKK